MTRLSTTCPWCGQSKVAAPLKLREYECGTYIYRTISDVTNKSVTVYNRQCLIVNKRRFFRS